MNTIQRLFNIKVSDYGILFKCFQLFSLSLLTTIGSVRAQGIVDAVLHSDVEKVKYWLDQDCDLSKASVDEKYPGKHIGSVLHLSTWKGDLRIVKMLVNCGADVNQRNAIGCTPLFNAAVWGKSDVAKYLLHKGANPDIANNDGTTALQAASACGAIEIVRALLEHRANKNLRDNDGNDAEYYARAADYSDIIILLHNYKPLKNYIELADSLNEVADIARANGKYSLSLKLYTESLDHQQSALSYTNLAAVYLLLRDTAKAVELYQKVIVDFAGSESMNSRCELINLFLNGKRIENFDAIVNGSQCNQLNKSIGEYYYATKNYPIAINYYEHCNEFNSDIAMWLKIASCYDSLSRYDSAVFYYQKIKSYDQSAYNKILPRLKMLNSGRVMNILRKLDSLIDWRQYSEALTYLNNTGIEHSADFYSTYVKCKAKMYVSKIEYESHLGNNSEDVFSDVRELDELRGNIKNDQLLEATVKNCIASFYEKYGDGAVNRQENGIANQAYSNSLLYNSSQPDVIRKQSAIGLYKSPALSAIYSMIIPGSGESYVTNEIDPVLKKFPWSSLFIGSSAYFVSRQATHHSDTNLVYAITCGVIGAILEIINLSDAVSSAQSYNRSIERQGLLFDDKYSLSLSNRGDHVSLDMSSDFSERSDTVRKYLGIGGSIDNTVKISYMAVGKKNAFFGLGMQIDPYGYPRIPYQSHNYTSPANASWVRSDPVSWFPVTLDLQLILCSKYLFVGGGYGLRLGGIKNYWYDSDSNTYWHNSSDDWALNGRGEWSVCAGFFLSYFGVRFDYTQYRRYGLELLIGLNK